MGEEVRGVVRYKLGRHKGMDPGGDPKGETGNTSMFRGGAYNQVIICGRGTSIITHLGNNVPTPKGNG